VHGLDKKTKMEKQNYKIIRLSNKNEGEKGKMLSAFPLHFFSNPGITRDLK
jgi:hypothetical protein